jgi:hypothetical protein
MPVSLRSQHWGKGKPYKRTNRAPIIAPTALTNSDNGISEFDR